MLRLRSKHTFPKADFILPKYGCFCFGLRTCVAVFAWCFSTASFGCIILAIIFAARTSALEGTSKVKDPVNKRKELWMLVGCLSAYGLLTLPLGILMLLGALKGRRAFILPWVGAGGVMIIAASFIIIPLKSVLSWPFILSICIILGLLTFAWVHALSLFYRMRPRPSLSGYTIDDTITVADIAERCRACAAKKGSL